MCARMCVYVCVCMYVYIYVCVCVYDTLDKTRNERTRRVCGAGVREDLLKY
jgi:hypothetical protein